MKQERDTDGALAGLRKKAESRLPAGLLDEKGVSTLSLEEIQGLVHELTVHQIELELQNEELLRSQLVLSESRDKYSDLYDFAPVGYLTLDKRGLILEVNLAGSIMLGRDRESLFHKPFSALVVKDDNQRFSAHLRHVEKTMAKQVCELELSRNGGAPFHARLESAPVLDQEGGAVAFRSVLSDISVLKQAQRELQEAHDKLEDRVGIATAELETSNRALLCGIAEGKEQEAALSASEQRFRAVFDSSSDCILLKDPSFRYTHVNHSTEQFFGLMSSEMVGRTPKDLFGESVGQDIMDVSRRALDGETIDREVTRTVRGELVTVHEILVPLLGAQKQATGIFTVLRNITERKAAIVPCPVPRREYPSAAMGATLSRAGFAARSNALILLQGESGSGKDYLAQWIHQQSPYASGPFFVLNCAALPGEIADSELFGHEKGAFTGAWRRKKGLLELAEGGTLLLNEVGELALFLQSKILTFLDTKSFTRVGGEKHVHVNARLIAASHRDLKGLVDTGEFLEPLFHRLNVFPLQVPPLRERLDDLPLLIGEISAQLAAEMQLSPAPQIDQASVRAMTRYPWPGNIRELRNVLERAMILSRGGILEVSLPETEERQGEWSYTVSFSETRSLNDMKGELTRRLCCEALRRSGGSKTKAAAMLGISRDALYRYLRRVDEVCTSSTDG